MNQPRIVIAADVGIAIRSSGDIADAIAACLGTAGMLLTVDDLTPAFFDLRTRLAGELFQKFINYKVRVAIVVANPGDYGERFGELANEHRTHNRIRIVGSKGEVTAWLSTEASGSA